MLIALIIVAINIYTAFQAKGIRDRSMWGNRGGKWIRMLAIAMIVLTLVQVVIGTDIRESIDMISSSLSGSDRSTWVAQLGSSFIWHRELALDVMIFNVLLFFMIV